MLSSSLCFLHPPFPYRPHRGGFGLWGFGAAPPWGALGCGILRCGGCRFGASSPARGYSRHEVFSPLLSHPIGGSREENGGTFSIVGPVVGWEPPLLLLEPSGAR